ncbi:MAG: hypothetical protein LBG60_17385, partial [Bifidobacteriaceae bacterium]|nr:hypothetical protein [Bifidobacteriaceae bacterium]
MLALYGAGMTAEEVAGEFGVDRSTVRSQARRRGVARPAGVTPELLAEYAAGVPVQELAARSGAAPEAVVRHARLNGIAVQPKTATLPQAAEIGALYTDGVPIKEIGERTGLRARAVRQALVAAGVEIRPAARRPVLAGKADEVAALRR